MGGHLVSLATWVGGPAGRIRTKGILGRASKTLALILATACVDAQEVELVVVIETTEP